MKKILSIFSMVVVFAGAVLANDNEIPNATSGVAVVKDGATFKLYYRGTDKNDVKISIHDENDNIVYSEVIKKSTGFVRPYNFSKLPEGKYTIEIADNSGTQLESVMYRRAQLDRIAHLQKVAGSQRYVLSLPKKSSGDINIRIFDANSSLIYEKNEHIAGDFAKMYNLEKFEGKFLFEITDGSGRATTISY